MLKVYCHRSNLKDIHLTLVISAYFPEILIEFSLFTHKYTNGLIMVTDLQGYYDKDEKIYILTDPAIQCKSIDLFGKTNLGKKMITKCLKTYKRYVGADDFKVPFGLK